MGREWKLPYLSYDETHRRAEAFLNKHNPNRIIPVPIEEILDLKLKINIVTLPDLVARITLDSYLEPDLKTIFIDQNVFEFVPRARFSFAHELGHLVLHREFYEIAKYSSSEEYKEARKTLLAPDADRRFDIQAMNFAGLLLVPRPELKAYFEKAKDMARQGGIEPDNVPRYFLDYSASWLSKQFDVTEWVIKKRIELDNLWELY
jgi:Zn-dependent peptidase ImmA (M78 family)